MGCQDYESLYEDPDIKAMLLKLVTERMNVMYCISHN